MCYFWFCWIFWTILTEVVVVGVGVGVTAFICCHGFAQFLLPQDDTHHQLTKNNKPLLPNFLPVQWSIFTLSHWRAGLEWRVGGASTRGHSQKKSAVFICTFTVGGAKTLWRVFEPRVDKEQRETHRISSCHLQDKDAASNYSWRKTGGCHRYKCKRTF